MRTFFLTSVSAVALMLALPVQAANQCRAIDFWIVHLDCGHDQGKHTEAGRAEPPPPEPPKDDCDKPDGDGNKGDGNKGYRR